MTQAEIDAKAAADKAAADAAAAKAAEDAKKGEKPDEEKTAEELKAEAEELERQLKERKEGASEEEIRANMLRRKQKAAEKLDRLNKGEGDEPTKQKGEIATRDLITLGQNGIEENSEQAKVLQKYVDAGIIKSYKEGFTHVGVKAELDAIKAKSTTKTVIDENDTDEVKLNTRKEIIANYEASGEVPTDPAAQKEIAKNNLKKMGL